MICIWVLYLEESKEQDLLLDMYHKHWSTLYHYVCTFIKDHATAEDIVQQVFLKLINNMDLLRYDTPEQNKAYLISMSRNMALNYLRDNKITCVIIDEYPDSLDEIDSLIFKLEPFACIEELYPKLSDKEKTILMLRYVWGLSDQEISDQIGLSIRSIHTCIYRLRKKLRKEGL